MNVERRAWARERGAWSVERVGARGFSRSTLHVPHARHAAFTLIEIMIVVCIMGIIMTMGVPLVYKVWRREPLTKAISGVVEVCSHARAQAIMHGTDTCVVFHPLEKRLEVSGGGGPSRSAQDATGPIEVSAPPVAASGLSAQIPDQIGIEMLDVNLTEYKDQEIARVRFHPNGTCDEMTLILVSEKGERREIKLELTTSLASVESNPLKFR
jgi:prepilin-type N-terminal cleavage/methylation domain-containing protein